MYAAIHGNAVTDRARLSSNLLVSQTLLPVILNHTPSGASTKTIVHYLQEIKSDKFCQFDYGRKKNLVVYNATEPPDYDFTNVTVPIALFYADNDLLVNDVVCNACHDLAVRLARAKEFGIRNYRRNGKSVVRD